MIEQDGDFFVGLRNGCLLSLPIWLAIAGLFFAGYKFGWQWGIGATLVLILLTAIITHRSHQPEQVSPRTMARIERR